MPEFPNASVFIVPSFVKSLPVLFNVSTAIVPLLVKVPVLVKELWVILPEFVPFAVVIVPPSEIVPVLFKFPVIIPAFLTVAAFVKLTISPSELFVNVL